MPLSDSSDTLFRAITKGTLTNSSCGSENNATRSWVHASRLAAIPEVATGDNYNTGPHHITTHLPTASPFHHSFMQPTSRATSQGDRYSDHSSHRLTSTNLDRGSYSGFSPSFAPTSSHGEQNSDRSSRRTVSKNSNRDSSRASGTSSSGHASNNIRRRSSRTSQITVTITHDAVSPTSHQSSHHRRSQGDFHSILSGGRHSPSRSPTPSSNNSSRSATPTSPEFLAGSQISVSSGYLGGEVVPSTPTGGQHSPPSTLHGATTEVRASRIASVGALPAMVPFPAQYYTYNQVYDPRNGALYESHATVVNTMRNPWSQGYSGYQAPTYYIIMPRRSRR